MGYLDTDLLTLVLSFFGLCLFAYVCKHMVLGARYKLPPGPPGWPLIGNALSLDLSKLHLSLATLVKSYGDVVYINVFTRKVIALNSFEAIDQVYVKNVEAAAACAGRPPSIGDYIFTKFQSVIFRSVSPKHIQMRKLLVKALRKHGDGSHLKEEVIQEELREYVLHEISNQNGRPFDPDDVIAPSVINFFTILLLGKRLEKNDKRFKGIEDACAALLSVFAIDIEMPLSAFPFIRHFTFLKHGQIFQEVMRTKRELRKILVEDQKASYMPEVCRGMMDEFISAQLKLEEDGAPLWITDDTLEGFATDIFVAGSQTTRCTLLSFVLALVNFPHVATRIQQEIDNVIGHNRLPCLKDRVNMPYLNAVILEVFRTAPAAPIPIPRMAMHDFSFGNYSVPRGAIIMANVWNVHHDERTFPNPNEFLPERFLDEAGKLLPIDDKRRRSVIPFSIGRRSCPGDTFATSRIFMYIATMLQRFDLERGDESCPPYEPANYPALMLIRPEPYKIRAVPRV